MTTAILTLAIIGILLSFYTLYVECKLGQNKNYKAVCDINNRMSCTKTFSSKYGKTFGISNAYPGLSFYGLIVLMILYRQTDFLLLITGLGVLFSLYLAYILYFKVKHFCLVCHGIYLVNILLLVFSYLYAK